MLTGALFWWVGVGILVTAEVLTGTFYLLMIALGWIVGGILHLLGASLHWQLAAATLTAAAATIMLRRSHYGRKQKRNISAQADINLDIGAILTVTHWRDGRARARYRGAEWDVELIDGEPVDAQFYQVHAMRGSCLLVRAKPSDMAS